VCCDVLQCAAMCCSVLFPYYMYSMCSDFFLLEMQIVR